MRRLIMYSRSYCHLCDDMRLALLALSPTVAQWLEVVDVDHDPAALALYDELVPVLIGQDDRAEPRMLCHYFLNEAVVREFMADAT
ncbi:MAG: glutaredoxin family protein [Oxalicibacterium faecigallinarum]|uniref:glutaredoxin family protein n=1 Tax=Oxalicibacterium faecigallinarum TaxID=573741 RepID=UPI002809F3F2|nr:glutaredoxin family protein [Oxalicibacterium faecigallinarum]MDQ7968157.1 glutaredoxin family protein [Oxalicibacterium faecigallinarum]